VSKPLDLKDVAERAGVSPERVQAMADEGVFQRDVGDLDGGSVRRAMLLSVCVDAGIPLETIGQAMRDGFVSLDVLDRQYYARWGEHLDMTWADLAAEQGIPFDVLKQMYAAVGFAPPEPQEHPRTDEPDLIAAGGVILRTGVEPDILLRMLRVYGENFRRIARSETGLWHDLVDVPAQRAGATQRELLDQGAEFGDAIMSVVDGSTMAIYRRMQEHAWMSDLVEHLELALVEAGVYTKPERPATMAFMDLSGYTALTEERGDVTAAELATSLAQLVQRTATHHDGEAMKFLGDGVMFRFRDPAAGVRGALEVIGETAPLGLPPAHVGMHIGAVIERDGDVFGRTVNLASRLSGRAAPGEVLVSREVVEACEGAIGFTPLGKVELKGVAEPVPLFRAEPV
jgi:class 3 adenylate cyclase